MLDKTVAARGSTLAEWAARPLVRFVVVVLAIALVVWGVAQPLIGQSTATEKKLLYVAVDGKVKVYDIGDNHRFVRDIPIRGTQVTRGIQACAQNQTLYVSYKYFSEGTTRVDGGIVAINLVNDQIRWTKQFDSEIDAFSLTGDCKKIYAAPGEVSLKAFDYVLDASNGNTITTIPVTPPNVGGTHNTIVGPSSKYAYLSSLKYTYLTVADTATDTALRKVGPFSAPIRPFVVNGKETYAFVNVDGLEGFEVADLKTGQVVHQVKIQPQTADPNDPNPVHGIGLTADETELWQTGGNISAPKVVVFDATVMPPRQVTSIPVATLPKWISFSIDNRYVYPATGDVIDRVQRKVVQQIAKSKRQIEIDFVDGVPIRAASMYGLGYAGAPQRPDASIPPGASPAPSLEPQEYLPYVGMGK